jgi:hypothetical protein
MGLTELFGWQGAVAAEFILTWVAIYFIFMRPRKGAPPGTDSRYDHRYRSRFKGWLKCNGKNHRIRLVDLNKSGALVTVGVPLAPGSPVFVFIESQKLMGWAEVRHCGRRGMLGYHIGLEFRGSLMRAMGGTWQFASMRGVS